MSIVSSIVTIILSFDNNYSVLKSTITVKGNSAFNAVYGQLVVTPGVSGQSINL